jgi:F420-dependent oxidoreductase-like protein
MKIGINGSGLLAAPNFETITAHAQQAVAEGFPTYWLAQVGVADTLTLLAALALRVPGIDFGTAVIPTYPRHPAMLASQALTTQALSGGRLHLGIGLSHQVVIEGMFGMSFDKPVRHMREYLSILMPLVDEKKVAYTGETLSANMTFASSDDPPCPVLVAALGPQMLRLAGAHTAGTILWMVGEKTVRDHIAPTLREAAAKAGRPAPRIVGGLPICVTDEPEAVRERAGRAFAMYGQLPSYRAMLDREGAASPADVAIIGSASYVEDRLSALKEAGATEFAAAEFAREGAESEQTRDALKRWQAAQ